NTLVAAQERTGTLLSRLLRREETRETARSRELLEFLGIAQVEDNLASNLSYGQQKLLDFGMALMPDPQLILLDEPMAGVNPTMIKNLMGHILALNGRGYTFVVIEHNMEVVMSLCRRIVVLSQGERIACAAAWRTSPRAATSFPRRPWRRSSGSGPPRGRARPSSRPRSSGSTRRSPSCASRGGAGPAISPAASSRCWRWRGRCSSSR